MKLLIIGGGPGGYVASIIASKKGAEVTLVEKKDLGGTCLNRGCIPTKTILHSAALFRETRNFGELGIEIGSVDFNLPAVMQRKEKIVLKLRNGIEYLLKKNGVNVVRGEACFADPHTVHVTGGGNELICKADKIIIATGSKPAELPFAPVDGVNILNSDHLLELKKIPSSMIIVGGGVIGCELAQAFSYMGTKVTIVEMLPEILDSLDTDLKKLMHNVLKKDGITIMTSCRLNSLNSSEACVRAEVMDLQGNKVELQAEKVLVSVGRKPQIENLNTQAIGLRLDEKGFIWTDEQQSTNICGIYAIGDVTGSMQLAHVASHQGLVAVKNMLGIKTGMDYFAVPQCIYTKPEIASMGVTQQNAGVETKTGMFPVSANGRALIENCVEGFSKVITEAENGTVIGVHLAGPNVTEMISGMAGVIGFEADIEDLENFIFAHPTVSEMIYESILDVNNQAIHK